MQSCNNYYINFFNSECHLNLDQNYDFMVIRNLESKDRYTLKKSIASWIKSNIVCVLAKVDLGLFSPKKSQVHMFRRKIPLKQM